MLKAVQQNLRAFVFSHFNFFHSSEQIMPNPVIIQTNIKPAIIPIKEGSYYFTDEIFCLFTTLSFSELIFSSTVQQSFSHNKNVDSLYSAVQAQGWRAFITFTVVHMNTSVLMSSLQFTSLDQHECKKHL